MDLERKFARFGDGLSGDRMARGDRRLRQLVWRQVDQGGDIVQKGAYGASLGKLKPVPGSGVKMLWQHDPSQPIGIWDEVREDASAAFGSRVAC